MFKRFKFSLNILDKYEAWTICIYYRLNFHNIKNVEELKNILGTYAQNYTDCKVFLIWILFWEFFTLRSAALQCHIVDSYKNIISTIFVQRSFGITLKGPI